MYTPPKRYLTVKASQVKKAIDKGKTFAPRDWQAQLLEVLLIPSVYKRWKSINTRFPDPTITRHTGELPYDGRGKHQEVPDWTIFHGYEFTYGYSGSCWNRARDDYYGHSPCVAWDGVRRETYSDFIRTIDMAYRATQEPERFDLGYIERNLDQHKVKFVNDL